MRWHLHQGYRPELALTHPAGPHGQVTNVSLDGYRNVTVVSVLD